jgi:hypothetical protein
MVSCGCMFPGWQLGLIARVLKNQKCEGYSYIIDVEETHYFWARIWPFLAEDGKTAKLDFEKPIWQKQEDQTKHRYAVYRTDIYWITTNKGLAKNRRHFASIILKEDQVVVFRLYLLKYTNYSTNLWQSNMLEAYLPVLLVSRSKRDVWYYCIRLP